MANEKKRPEDDSPAAMTDALMRRQSAPAQTAESYLAGQKMAADINGVNTASDKPVNGFLAVTDPVNRDAVQRAALTLMKYKTGKANLEARIVSNEQWYKLRHWEVLKGKKNEIQPTSAWLFNSLANKHADAMDNYPSPNFLPREEGDKAVAEMLSSVVPVLLDQIDFEAVYDDVWNYKLKFGTGCYGVFWDSAAMNGLGEISVQMVDLLNLFWEPGVKDIQKSQNLFYVNLADNEMLLRQYPQLEGKLGSSTVDVAKYAYDDTVDTSDKSAVIDWYYKKNYGQKTVLHYCKFVNGEVLYSSENDPKLRERGYYDHGMYPFILDPLFRVEGSPCGFGYIDVGKSAQEYIDRGNKAVLENMLANASPRYFIRNDGGVKEEEYADMTKAFVHCEGGLGSDSVVPIDGKPLSGIYFNLLNAKIDELKETTGNRDISTGGSASGVTAASAIAAMQEAGSKLSRNDIRGSYRAYRALNRMIVEDIRQFWDLPRCFRIMGKDGTERYVTFSNEGLRPQYQGIEMGIDLGYRIPMFDIEITAQKASPYSKMSNNELALQFYSAGFFAPQNADMALACLDMMDFDRKEMIMQKVMRNGTLYQQLQQMQGQMMMLAQMVDQARGSNIAAQLAAQFSGGPAVVPVDGSPVGSLQTEDAMTSSGAGEAKNTKQARERVADSTSPV